MAPKNSTEASTRKVLNKGAWTAEEDKKLAQYIEIHGAKRWKTVALKAGLNRCGKSCRLRWLNYLRPNIKRGNISDDEEDLIVRLHKLLGNRWSLIAGRLPGRTDNEIKNYWNSHLSKKIKKKEKALESSNPPDNNKCNDQTTVQVMKERGDEEEAALPEINFDVDGFFDFSSNGSSYDLGWVNELLELGDDSWLNQKR